MAIIITEDRKECRNRWKSMIGCYWAGGRVGTKFYILTITL